MKTYWITLLFLLATNLLFSQMFYQLPKPLYGSHSHKPFYFQYYPSLKLGTHVNELAIQAKSSISYQLNQRNTLILKYHASLRANLTYLGIPGPSFGMVNKASLSYAFGRSTKSPNYLHFHSQHRSILEYYYMHYLSTDQTQQFSGGFTYTLVLKKSYLKFRMENDFMAFLGLDEFRTGGGTLDYKRIKEGKIYGIGLGALLWTGSTKGLTNLDFGQSYDMSNQFGADFSHGIVFLNLHYQGLSLSLGYDSEPLRMAIQDNLHRLIDDGTIPGGSQSRNRIFIQLNLFDFEFLY